MAVSSDDEPIGPPSESPYSASSPPIKRRKLKASPAPTKGSDSSDAPIDGGSPSPSQSDSDETLIAPAPKKRKRKTQEGTSKSAPKAKPKAKRKVTAKRKAAAKPKAKRKSAARRAKGKKDDSDEEEEEEMNSVSSKVKNNIINAIQNINDARTRCPGEPGDNCHLGLVDDLFRLECLIDHTNPSVFVLLKEEGVEPLMKEIIEQAPELMEDRDARCDEGQLYVEKIKKNCEAVIAKCGNASIYRKPGQKFHIPSNGDGIRVYYESLFEQNANDYNSIKYMVEYGCLEMDTPELDEAWEKFQFLKGEGAFKRQGGLRTEYDTPLEKLSKKWEKKKAEFYEAKNKVKAEPV